MSSIFSVNREFYESVKNHQFENAQSLLFQGANINSKLTISLMLEAVIMEDNEIVDFLIFNKIDLNIKSVGGSKILHRAIFIGDYSIIKSLIEGGALVNSRSSDVREHLDFALYNYFSNHDDERLKCVKLLLDNGAEIFFNDRESTLDMPIFYNDCECVKLLLNYVNEEHIFSGNLFQNLISKTKSPEMKKILLDYIEETLAFRNKCPEEETMN
jgi:ankyrin repeat protein